MATLKEIKMIKRLYPLPTTFVLILCHEFHHAHNFLFLFSSRIIIIIIKKLFLYQNYYWEALLISFDRSHWNGKRERKIEESLREIEKERNRERELGKIWVWGDWEVNLILWCFFPTPPIPLFSSFSSPSFSFCCFFFSSHLIW